MNLKTKACFYTHAHLFPEQNFERSNDDNMAGDNSSFMVEICRQIFLIKALALVCRASFHESQEFREKKADEKESSFWPKTARHLSELQISNCPNDIRQPGHSRVTTAPKQLHPINVVQVKKPQEADNGRMVYVYATLDG